MPMTSRFQPRAEDPEGGRASVLAEYARTCGRCLIVTTPSKVIPIAKQLKQVGLLSVALEPPYEASLKSFNELPNAVLIASLHACHGWKVDARALIFAAMLVDPSSPEYRQAAARLTTPVAPAFVDCIMASED